MISGVDECATCIAWPRSSTSLTALAADPKVFVRIQKSLVQHDLATYTLPRLHYLDYVHYLDYIYSRLYKIPEQNWPQIPVKFLHGYYTDHNSFGNPEKRSES